jgi:hypothetical protein
LPFLLRWPDALKEGKMTMKGNGVFSGIVVIVGVKNLKHVVLDEKKDGPDGLGEGIFG